jgi:hypothetical protein
MRVFLSNFGSDEKVYFKNQDLPKPIQEYCQKESLNSYLEKELKLGNTELERLEQASEYFETKKREWEQRYFI